MNLFSRLLGKQEGQDPRFIKLANNLSRRKFKATITKAHFLLGIPNTSENYELLKKAISNNTIRQLKAEIDYDVRQDNLELYLICDSNNKSYLVILLDPYELYNNEEILDIIPIVDRVLDFESELIFSSI